MAKFTMMFVCCLIVLVNVCIARPDKEEMMEKMMALTKACQAEVGAADSDTEDMANKKPAASMLGKCLRACVMKKFGMLDANGIFNMENALEFAKKCANGDADKLQKMTAVIESCAGVEQPKNECEAAEQYKMCFWDKTKNMNMAW